MYGWMEGWIGVFRKGFWVKAPQNESIHVIKA